MKYLVTAAAFLATLLAVGATTLVIVIVFAGPHSDLLPPPLQVVVFIAGWVAVLGIPILVARAVWKRVGGKRVA